MDAYKLLEARLALTDTLAIARHFRLQWEPVPQAWVLLYPEGRVQLNGSAGEIMQRVDGKRSIATIVDELQQAFNEADLRADVLAGLELALARGWLKVTNHAT